MRPFLHAKLGEAESGGFLVQSPTLAEVKVGAETPIGTYDLTLFDEGQELVRKPGAIAVIPKPVPPVRSGMAMLHVRFITRPETADVIHVGDLDVSATVVASAPPAASAPAAPAEARSAAIIAIEPGRQQLNSLAYVDAAPNKPYQVQQPMTAFAATLRVPVTMTKTGWQYKDKPVKVGAPIVFETTSGYLEGSILSMTVAGAEDKPVG